MQEWKKYVTVTELHNSALRKNDLILIIKCYFLISTQLLMYGACKTMKLKKIVIEK